MQNAENIVFDTKTKFQKRRTKIGVWKLEKS